MCVVWSGVVCVCVCACVRACVCVCVCYLFMPDTQLLQCCSGQVVDAFPHGDLTVVGERGLTLDSSTQAKITLARSVSFSLALCVCV